MRETTEASALSGDRPRPTGTPADGAVVSSDASFEAELWEWVAQVTGGEVVAPQRVVAGTRESWSADVRSGDSTLPVIVRRGRDTLQVYGDYTREVAIYQALGDTPVPVPSIYGVRPDWRVMLAERVPGTSDLDSMSAENRESASDGLMRAIAALHALDPARLELPPMVIPHTAAEHATLDLDHWQQFHRLHCPPDPVVSFVAAWLREHASNDVPRTVLVQGDTGPGNFVAHNGEVTAVVDWELSHLGDPYEDLGWVVTRALLFPFGDLGRRMRVYEAAGGVPYDRDRIWHGAVTGMLKCLIAEDAVRVGGAGDAEYPVVVSGPVFHGRLAILAVLQAEGLRSLPIDPLDVPPGTGEQATALAYARTTLRERLLPNLADRVQIDLTRSVLRTIRHLELNVAIGPAIEAADRADLQSLLRSDVDDPLELRRQFCDRVESGATDGELDPVACLRYLDRRVQRETARSAELLGPMARTPLPELD